MMRTSRIIPCFIIAILASLFILNPVPVAGVSPTAIQEQFQPSPLRDLQWWASSVPYRPIHSTIAVVDSGADPEMDPTGNLGRNIIAGWDAINKTPEFHDLDPNKHGTHIAGITCGSDHAMVPSVPLLIVRASEIDGQGKERLSVQGCADGIRWAVDNGAQVVICPWNSIAFISEVADAVSYAEEKGVIIAVAVGNDTHNLDEESNCWNLPNSNILRVAAVQQGNVIAPNSAYGHGMVEIAAPGEGFLMVESTDTGFVWTPAGTSAAAAFAGTIAAMLRDSISWEEVIPRLCATVSRQEALQNRVWTGGVLDTRRALAGEINPPLDSISFKGKVKKKNKKLSLSGTEAFLTLQATRPVLRVWLQQSLAALVEPEPDGSFSYVIKQRFKSGAQVRVQSPLGGEMTWDIP